MPCLPPPPPRLPGADSAPWNKQSPTMTADTRHSPPGLPSDQWGLAQGLGWDLGSCLGRFWFLPIWSEDHTSYVYGYPIPLVGHALGTLMYIQQTHFIHKETDSAGVTC